MILGERRQAIRKLRSVLPNRQCVRSSVSRPWGANWLSRLVSAEGSQRQPSRTGHRLRRPSQGGIPLQAPATFLPFLRNRPRSSRYTCWCTSLGSMTALPGLALGQNGFEFLDRVFLEVSFFSTRHKTERLRNIHHDFYQINF